MFAFREDLFTVSVMLMPPELFVRYEADPLGTDLEVRRQLKIPEGCYYAVAMWPPEGAGKVTVERERVVRSKKISKSG